MKRNLLWVLASLIAISVGIRFLVPSSQSGASQKDGFANASSQPGYEEVKNLGDNPVAGDASVAEAEWFLFQKHCIDCHASVEPRERTKANSHQAEIDLNDPSQYKFGWGDLGIFRSIKYGFAKSTAHQGLSLRDKDIWILAKYIRRLQLESRQSSQVRVTTGQSSLIDARR